MKMFIAEYGWQPSGPAKSVVFATDIEAAQEFVKNGQPEIVFVNDMPKEGRASEWTQVECRLEEQEIEEGVVYTGYHCC